MLFLLLAAVATNALAVRPRISFTAAVNVTPYTARWRAAGLLGEVERRVVEVAQPRLNAFEFLEWAPGGDAGARMLLSIEEDPNSRPAGARPWVLVMQLTTASEVRRSKPIRVARAGQAHDLSRNVVTAASDFIVLVQRAFDELTVEETANVFVKEVLSGVSIADEIDPYDSHALINVPYADLHATSYTRLFADFRGAPERRLPMQVQLFLAPLADVDARTECSVTAKDAALQAKEEWTTYMKGRTPPVKISVVKYDRDRRSAVVRSRDVPP